MRFASNPVRPCRFLLHPLPLNSDVQLLCDPQAAALTLADPCGLARREVERSSGEGVLAHPLPLNGEVPFTVNLLRRPGLQTR